MPLSIQVINMATRRMLAMQIYTPDVMVVEELEESLRGSGGFGSTG